MLIQKCNCFLLNVPVAWWDNGTLHSGKKGCFVKCFLIPKKKGKKSTFTENDDL